MTDRIGVCVGCGTRFKVPPTFQGRVAQCRKCGKTVSIRDASSAERVAHEKKAKSTAKPASERSVATPPPTARPAAAKTRTVEDPQTATTVAFILGAILLLAGGSYYVWQTVKQASAYDDESDSASHDGERSGRSKRATPVPSPPPVPTPHDSNAGRRADSSPPSAPIDSPQPATHLPPPEPARLATKLAFSHYSPPKHCTATAWMELETSIRSAFFEKGGESERQAARKLAASDRIAAISAMINTLDGLDLADPTQASVAWDLVEAVQSTSLDVIRLPPRPAAGDPEATVQYELRVVRELTRYWSEQVAAPEKFELELATAKERAERRDF